MAWPVSGQWETRTAGVTTIKKAWADDLDAALNGIYGGTSSLRALMIDGTGYQAVTPPAGSAELDGAAGDGHGDTNPSGQSLVVPTTRRLFWRWKMTSGPIYARLYWTPNTWELTLNAGWTTADDWLQDDTAKDSIRIKAAIPNATLAHGDLYVQYQAPAGGTTHFSEGSWVNNLHVHGATGATDIFKALNCDSLLAAAAAVADSFSSTNGIAAGTTLSAVTGITIASSMIMSAAGIFTKYNSESLDGVGHPYLLKVKKDQAAQATGAQDVTVVTFTPGAGGLYRVAICATTPTAEGGVGLKLQLDYQEEVNAASKTVVPCDSLTSAGQVQDFTFSIRAAAGTAIRVSIKKADHTSTMVSATVERLV